MVWSNGLHQPNVLEATIEDETTVIPIWQFPFLDEKTPPEHDCRNGKFVISLFSGPPFQTRTNLNK